MIANATLISVCVTNCLMVFAALALVGCRQRESPEEARKPGDPDASLERFFANNMGSLRLRVTHVGPSDKPVFPLIVAVAESKAELEVEEFESDQGVRYRRAFVIIIREDEGACIIHRLFEDGYLGSRFACPPDEAGKLGGFHLTISAGGQEVSVTITREGNASLRQMILDCLNPSSEGAVLLRQLRGKR